MNKELIQKLAERAHADVRSDEEANGVCFKDYNLQFQKAFAKLLILECAKVAKEVDGGDTGFNDYKSGRQWAGIDILKHFGVEE